MRSLACVEAASCTCSGDLSHLISGWRRITPVAEHGASSKIRSKRSPSHQLSVAAASVASKINILLFVKAQPSQVFLHASEPGFALINDGEIHSGNLFQDMARFTPGCCAGVQYVMVLFQLKQSGRQLRSRILHGKSSFLEAGQQGYSHCRADLYRMLQCCVVFNFEAASVSFSSVSGMLNRQFSLNHSAPACWFAVAIASQSSGQSFFSDSSNQPGCAKAFVLRFQLRAYFCLFPLKPSQHCIDDGNGPGFAEFSGAFCGFMNRGMRCAIIFPQLVQADQDQALDVPVFAPQWLAQQLSQRSIPVRSASAAHRN